jgi:hypothetical protein
MLTDDRQINLKRGCEALLADPQPPFRGGFHGGFGGRR